MLSPTNQGSNCEMLLTEDKENLVPATTEGDKEDVKVDSPSSANIVLEKHTNANFPLDKVRQQTGAIDSKSLNKITCTY